MSDSQRRTKKLALAKENLQRLVREKLGYLKSNVMNRTLVDTSNDEDSLTPCDLKVSRSYAKIYKNFANYFLKTKANNKCFIVLKCTCKGLTEKHK